MKTYIIPTILFLALTTRAQKMPSNLTSLTKSNEGRTNGTMMMDPASCKIVLIRDGLEISLLPVTLQKKVRDEKTQKLKTIDYPGNNFLVKFPDGDTVVADIAGTNPSRPACFHSLTTNSTKHRVRPVIYNKDGLENCLNRPQDGSKYWITDELRHLSDTEYTTQAEKDGDAFQKANSLKVQSGVGLGFYSSSYGKQTGPNVETKNLLPDALAEEDKKTLAACQTYLNAQKQKMPAARPDIVAEKANGTPK